MAYLLTLDAPGRRAMLHRIDKDHSRALDGGVALASLVVAPAPTHLELTCGLPVITARVNWALVASLGDVTYTGGRAWLGASNVPDDEIATTALFTNLLVCQDQVNSSENSSGCTRFSRDTAVADGMHAHRNLRVAPLLETHSQSGAGRPCATVRFKGGA